MAATAVHYASDPVPHERHLDHVVYLGYDPSERVQINDQCYRRKADDVCYSHIYLNVFIITNTNTNLGHLLLHAYKHVHLISLDNSTCRSHNPIRYAYYLLLTAKYHEY